MADLCFCEDSEIKPHEHCVGCRGILNENDCINYCRECLKIKQRKQYEKQRAVAK